MDFLASLIGHVKWRSDDGKLCHEEAGNDVSVGKKLRKLNLHGSYKENYTITHWSYKETASSHALSNKEVLEPSAQFEPRLENQVY